MANATAAVRITPRQDSRSIGVYIADGYTCYNGTVLTISTVDGYARPATGTNNGTIIAGILAPKDQNLANKGAVVGNASGVPVATDVTVGVFDLPQDGSVTEANVGGNIYLLNDHEVTTNNGSGLTVLCVAINADSSVQTLIKFGGGIQ